MKNWLLEVVSSKKEIFSLKRRMKKAESNLDVLKIVNSSDKLQIKDVYAIFISFIALVLSGITLYNQYYDKEESLGVSVLDVIYDKDAKEVKVQLAFVNAGKVPFMVTSYDFGVNSKSSNNGMRLIGGHSLLDNSFNDSFMIKPGDMIIKNKNVPVSDYGVFLLTNKSCLPTAMYLNVSAFNTGGERYHPDFHIADFTIDNKAIYTSIYRQVNDILLDDENTKLNESSDFIKKVEASSLDKPIKACGGGWK